MFFFQHAWGHKFACAIRNSIRYCCGCGMASGELCESLNAYIGRVGSYLKYCNRENFFLYYNVIIEFSKQKMLSQIQNAFKKRLEEVVAVVKSTMDSLSEHACELRELGFGKIAEEAFEAAFDHTSNRDEHRIVKILQRASVRSVSKNANDDGAGSRGRVGGSTDDVAEVTNTGSDTGSPCLHCESEDCSALWHDPCTTCRRNLCQSCLDSHQCENKDTVGAGNGCW